MNAPHNLPDLTVDKIKNAIPGAVEDVIDFRGERTLLITRERVVEVCRLLLQDEDLNFNFFSDLTATDYFPQEPRFAVIYHLYSMPNNVRIRLKVFLEGDDAHLPTITPVYPSANWYEREVWDLFGITFDGHPDLRRILMPNDWEGHPLRRDYPLGYEEVQFSFNWAEIQARKPHPQE